MASRSDKIFQDPRTAGSLSNALQTWQRLHADRRDHVAVIIIFTLACWSESRATRVAGFLRRRRACSVTRVHQVAGASRDTWHVHGSMRPAIHSLEDLESTWTWLRRAATSHQAALLRVSLSEAA